MTTAAADTAPVTATMPRAGLRDFSDWLSPMLVKELRQGLKSPVFTWGLIAMQAVLAVMTVSAMSEGNILASSRWFWWSAAALICLLLPLRVTNALREEMGGNTLDTLVLTRLSAWRIVLGKWLAASSLQILVAVTVLPYLIMRYFAGGVNMPVELAWLAVLVAFGLLVTAMMLGLSWFRYFLVRALVMLVILYGAAAACTGIIYMVERSGWSAKTERLLSYGWPGLVWLVTIAVWLGFFFLDLGVARIAPISENRATRRRLAGLTMLLIGGASCCLIKDGGPSMGPVVILAAAAGVVCIQALCESPNNMVPVLQPFVKRGVLGRLAGRLLYPGWHTAFFFSLVLFMAALGIAIYLYFLQQQAMLKASLSAMGRYSSPVWPPYGGSGPYLSFIQPSGDLNYTGIMRWATISSGTLGALILPVVLWRIIAGMKRWSFWHWLGLLVCGAMVHWIAMSMTKNFGVRAGTVLALPTGGLASPFIAVQEVQERIGAMYPSGWRDWSQRNEWEDLVREEMNSSMCIATGFSISAWLTLAVAFALSELRETRRAEDALARALAVPRLPASNVL